VKIGIVVNPNSGNREAFRRFLPSLAPALNGKRIYCTASTLIYVQDHLRPQVIGSKEVTKDFRDTEHAGRDLAEMDMILSFGGDGTVSDLIYGMRSTGKQVPIANVALGTANCGPFTAFRSAEDVARFDFNRIAPQWTRGLDVFEDGQYRGTAFNDVVISDTLVSTVDNEIKTVDAARFFYQSERILKHPGTIDTEDCFVAVNGRAILPQGRISQIILSPFSQKEEQFYAFRAVNGLFCKIPYCDSHSGMILSSQPIICIDDHSDSACADVRQVIFRDKDVVQASNFNAFCILDGNPRIDLSRSKEIQIQANEFAGLCVKENDQ